MTLGFTVQWWMLPPFFWFLFMSYVAVKAESSFNTAMLPFLFIAAVLPAALMLLTRFL